MERVVFNLAVAGAICLAIVMGLGVGRLHWEFGDAFGADPVVRGTAQRVAAHTYAVQSVQIDHAAARVIVIPEARQDVSVEIENPGGVPTPRVEIDGDHVRIDGQLRGRVRDCRADSIVLSGYGEVAAAQLPQITIHSPMTVSIGVDTGSFTQIGAAQAVDGSFSGCGATRIADVASDLKLEVAGSGQVETGTAQTLDLDIGGSGQVRTGAIARRAEVQLGGSGEVILASLTGELKSSIGGSGRLRVEGGVITRADMEVAGSGSTHVAAPVQSLSVDIAGSGQVGIDHGPTQEADLSVGGSGRVELAGPVSQLKVELAGSGGVDVAGSVQNLDAEIAGSGMIHVPEVTGELHKEIFGPGQVVVGR